MVGLEFGGGPSIVVVDQSMRKSLSTTTMSNDIYAFIFGQKGLMAGVGPHGQQGRTTERLIRYVHGPIRTGRRRSLSGGLPRERFRPMAVLSRWASM